MTVYNSLLFMQVNFIQLSCYYGLYYVSSVLYLCVALALSHCDEGTYANKVISEANNVA